MTDAGAWQHQTPERKGGDMNQLIVVAFDHLEDARNAMKRLRGLEAEGRIRFEDTGIVERDADGETHVRNEVSGTTEGAAVIGGLIGGIVTFAFPLAGIAIGAALGAAVGRLLGTGVSGDFIEEVKNNLTPGRSALFLVVKESDADAVDRGASRLPGRGPADDAGQRGRGGTPPGAEVAARRLCDRTRSPSSSTPFAVSRRRTCAGTLHAVADAGYRSVELAGLPETAPGELARLLEETGLRPVAAHEAIERLRADAAGVADRLVEIACPRVIVPWMPDEDRRTADDVRRFAAELGTFAARLADRGSGSGTTTTPSSSMPSTARRSGTCCSASYRPTSISSSTSTGLPSAAGTRRPRSGRRPAAFGCST